MSPIKAWVGHRAFTKRKSKWVGRCGPIIVTFHECPIYHPGSLPTYYWVGEASYRDKGMAVGMPQTMEPSDFRLHLTQADQIVRLLLACVERLDKESKCS